MSPTGPTVDHAEQGLRTALTLAGMVEDGDLANAQALILGLDAATTQTTLLSMASALAAHLTAGCATHTAPAPHGRFGREGLGCAAPAATGGEGSQGRRVHSGAAQQQATPPASIGPATDTQASNRHRITTERGKAHTYTHLPHTFA